MNICRLFTSVGPAMLLTACASAGDYPSLAQRPVERVEGAFAADTPQPAPAPPPIPSADLVARIAGLKRDANALHAQFVEVAPAATRIATAAGAKGSDSWANAQVALADLDSLRSRVAVYLADLDALWVDANVERGPRDAIGPARDSVQALVAQEDEVLARLRARVGD